MGLYDIVLLDDNIKLPDFPANEQNFEWQSKTVYSQPCMNTYKITNNGDLLRKNEIYRPMTDKEVKERANKAGYDSWESWEDDESAFGPLESWKRKVDEVKWINHNQHGSFEIHTVTDELGENNHTYWSYEIRFTDGKLDEILFLDSR